MKKFKKSNAKIYCMFVALLTCIIAASFSRFHNIGFLGYNDACGIQDPLAPLNKDRVRKSDIFQRYSKLYLQVVVLNFVYYIAKHIS